MPVRYFKGLTAEGLPLEFTCYYPPNSTMPVRIVGSYQALDGPGAFDATTYEDLPWVVAEGDFRCVGGSD